MTGKSTSLPFAQKWHWPLLGALADLRIRYGIKLGLAALVALYCALLVRLEHPSWAVLTALVMMGSHYVGSIAVKGIMRVLGTIGGALMGIWLVGDYVSTPASFCPPFSLSSPLLAINSANFPQARFRMLIF